MHDLLKNKKIHYEEMQSNYDSLVKWTFSICAPPATAQRAPRPSTWTEYMFWYSTISSQILPSYDHCERSTKHQKIILGNVCGDNYIFVLADFFKICMSLPKRLHSACWKVPIEPESGARRWRRRVSGRTLNISEI